MKIDFNAFLNSLPLMLKGMVGIFVVTLVIIGCIFLLNSIFVKKSPKKDEQDKIE